MNPPWKILLVEDEAHIAEGIAFNLKKQGYQVQIAEDGIKALELWEEFRPDLVVLDIMLPKIDGYGVLKAIRKTNAFVPVLILSAKGQSMDRIQGLSNGGDDYLSKPFELEEFILRVKNLLQRVSRGPRPSEDQSLDFPHATFEFGANKIDFKTYEAQTPSGTIQLTDQEIRILQIFILNAGKILSRKELLHQAWGYTGKVETRTIDNFLVRFRKYFEVDTKNPRHFKSLRSKGYIFLPGEKGQ